LNDLLNSGNADSQMIVYTLPKHYFNNFVYGAFAILKFLALHIANLDIDYEKARNGLRLYYDNIQRLSKGPRDEFARLCLVLQFLAKAERDQVLSIATNAKTRSAASLVVDTVRARDLLEGKHIDSSPSTTDQNAQFSKNQFADQWNFPWDTSGMQNMELWTDDYFDFLQSEASSSDWPTGFLP
jgi:hypothetical protein